MMGEESSVCEVLSCHIVENPGMPLCLRQGQVELLSADGGTESH